MELINIGKNTYYFSQDNNVLSPKIGLMVGDEASLLIDYGNSSKQKELLQRALNEQNITNIKYMVLTHFHKDHLGSLSDKETTSILNYELICSKHTGKYLNQAFTETSDMVIDLGNHHVRIIEVMSTHAKGSIIIYDVENKLAFLGDALYPASKNERSYYDKGKTIALIRTLRQLNIETYILSHDQMDDQATKDFIDNLYKKVLKMQEPFYYLEEE